jgi:hypothetical protein
MGAVRTAAFQAAARRGSRPLSFSRCHAYSPFPALALATLILLAVFGMDDWMLVLAVVAGALLFSFIMVSPAKIVGKMKGLLRW